MPEALATAAQPLRRRDVIAMAPAALALGAMTRPPPPVADPVRERARALAARPYEPPPTTLPPGLAALDYDAYREVQFRSDRAIWRDAGLPFQLQFFHRGWLFREPVDIAETVGRVVRPIAFDTALFRYGRVAPGALPADMGFAGFRILAPLNDRQRFDEVAAFLGASYFRAVAKGLVYGLSARGLALGSGEPGEEFPRFRAFWIERPAPGAQTLIVHALLDSPSTSGAYRFDITPGDLTVMTVSASLFPRRTLLGPGIAPLTSMYAFGSEQPRRVDDFRPQVHDSDGLLIDNRAGERIWRPLSNPRTIQTSDFLDMGPRGFGLLQRQRDFAAYQDLEANYHRRPGAWITPLEGFGAGAVRLIELPGKDETEDNIVAFWRPAAPLEAGREHRFRYRLSWGLAPEPRGPLARWSAWREGRGGQVGQGGDSRKRRFALDIGPIEAAAIPSLRAEVNATSGSISVENLQPNASIGGARLSFEFDPGPARVSELRASLTGGQGRVSEVWIHRWLA